MKKLTIPALQIEPDLFGSLTITVAIEGYEATPNGVLKWIADAAKLNPVFTPSLRSIDVAERFNISRRTLEGYRVGVKVPVTVCWMIRQLLNEIREKASGLVLGYTPSETATRDKADARQQEFGLSEVERVKENPKTDRRKETASTKNKVTPKKKKTAQRTKQTAKKQSKSSKSKTIPSTKCKSPSPKKRNTSSK